MGMGYGACYADVVEDEFVRKICPTELCKLEDALSDEEMDMEGFAQEAQYGEYPVDEVETAYVKLTKAFKKETGLELGIGFHDQHDEGDRYDDLNGVYWSVGGVYELTKAGKKYEEHISRKQFVTFG